MALEEKSQHLDDEAVLHRLGYAQVLYREMGGFSNFAISFTIISILAGCLTSYYIAFNNGGPVAITWGWLLVGVFCVLVAMAMGEIASAMPTAGALYFWASKLGGPAWGWFTGWFNLVGEIAVTAAIQYGSAIFMTAVLNLWFPAIGNGTGTIFVVFTLIAAMQLGLNLLNINVLALLNTISAWWHMVGVAVVVAVLIIVPDTHQPASFVFGETINNSGFSDTSFWFVFGIGLLMAQYTITGFDASAHMSEETRSASRTSALGMIMAVAASVFFGFILLVAVTFAVPDVQGVLDAEGDAVIYIFTESLGETGAVFLLLIAVIAQLFCGTASVTASSRMMFAFSRDQAVPFHNVWRKVASNRAPVNAVIAICVCSWALMLPTLVNGVLGYAVGTSIAVIGLYIAFALPIILRIKAGDRFEPGAWSLGHRYKWVSTTAVVWITLVCILFLMPLSPDGVPFSAEFSWEAMNYAPLTVGGALILFGGWYLLSARKWFTGPVPEGGSLAELQSIEDQLAAEAGGAPASTATRTDTGTTDTGTTDTGTTDPDTTGAAGSADDSADDSADTPAEGGATARAVLKEELKEELKAELLAEVKADLKAELLTELRAETSANGKPKRTTRTSPARTTTSRTTTSRATATSKPATSKTAASKTATSKTAASKTAASKTAASKTAASKTAASKTAAAKAEPDATEAEQPEADTGAARKTTSRTSTRSSSGSRAKATADPASNGRPDTPDEPGSEPHVEPDQPPTQ